MKRKPLFHLALIALATFIGVSLAAYAQLQTGLTALAIILLIVNPLLMSFGNILPATSLGVKLHLRFTWATKSPENLAQTNKVTAWLWLSGGFFSLIALVFNPLVSFYICVGALVAPWFYCQNKLFQEARKNK